MLPFPVPLPAERVPNNPVTKPPASFVGGWSVGVSVAAWKRQQKTHSYLLIKNLIRTGPLKAGRIPPRIFPVNIPAPFWNDIL